MEPAQETVITRSLLAPPHILAAALLRDAARKIEIAATGETCRAQRKPALNGAAVVEAYAYVEATINEFFAEALDSVNPDIEYPGMNLPGSPLALGKDAAKQIAEGWAKPYMSGATNGKSPEKRLATPLKYQHALTLMDKPIFDEAGTPFIEVDLIRVVRNALMHEPAGFRVAYSTIPDRKAPPLKWEDALKERSLKGEFRLTLGTHPHQPERRLFFPEQLLSASFAHWCIRRAIAFVEEFFKRLGLTRPPFNVERTMILPVNFDDEEAQPTPS